MEAAEVQGKLHIMDAEYKKLKDEYKQILGKLESTDMLKKRYAEQLACVRKQISRESILSKLPPLPSANSEVEFKFSSAHRRIHNAAADLCRRIKKEPGISPRIEAMLDRLLQEIGMHVEERHVMARREAILLQMLTGDSKK